MLHGIDVSNWNQAISPYFDECDFVIMKATEGLTFLDKLMPEHYMEWTGKTFDTPSNKCYGFYHYARPEYNRAQDEARWFLSNIRPHIGRAILALDWEGKALQHSPDWALEFLNYVYNQTGVKPLLYTGKAEINSGKYKKISENDFGLWVASWEETSPIITDWKVTALWQYTSKPIDKNYFFGNYDSWHAYANPFGKINRDEIKVGMKVRPTTRVAYDGTICNEFVLTNVYDVMEVKGDRVVIGKLGVVTAAYHISNLEIV